MSRSPDDHHREYRGSRHSVKREPESRDEYLRGASSTGRDEKRDSRIKEEEPREADERPYSRESSRSYDDRRSDRAQDVPQEEPQDLSRSSTSVSESQRLREDNRAVESRKKKSKKHHKHNKSPRSHRTHKSPRRSRWEQPMEENRDNRYLRDCEMNQELKRCRLYRNDEEIRLPRVKLERDDDIEIVDCSDNKLRTQKRRLEKKLARTQPPAAPAVIVLDGDTVPQQPPAPPSISQSQISVISPESLLLPPVKKFDEEYMVPEDNLQPEASMDTQYSDCIQAVVFGDKPREYHQPQAQEPPALPPQYLQRPHPQEPPVPPPQYLQRPHPQEPPVPPPQYLQRPHPQEPPVPPPQYLQQPQAQEPPAPQEYLQQPPYVPQQQIVTERYFKKEIITPEQQFFQKSAVPQPQYVQLPPPPQQQFIQQSAIPEMEFYEEEERKPFSNFPSVQIPQVVQVRSIATPEITSTEIEARCKICGMVFIHSCKYPPNTDPRSIFLEPGRLRNCKCSVIFLHTRQQCQQTITKCYVQSKNETSLVKQVNRIHKYECCDCDFKCTIGGIRYSSHYWESLTRKDGSLRDKGKKIERDLQAMLRRVDDISRGKYPHEPPSVQQTHVNIRRCLISICTQSCCVLYHECPPKISCGHNDDGL